jgi:pectinesterase
MLTYLDFKNAKEFDAADFVEAVKLCLKLRMADKDGLYKINIGESSVKGQFVFPFSNFCLIGKKAVITGNRYAKEMNEDMKANTTWRTPTLTVIGSNNIFVGLTIENTALNPAVKGTSVALSVYGNENTFVSCTISSTQDTLFLGPLPDDLSARYLGFLPDYLTQIEGNLRTYFSNCHILGSVDFIFGAGQGVFLTCAIESVEDGRMSVGFVTAPAHSLKDDFGFLFYDCSFISQTIFSQRVYLGRPWRDFGKCCFINCSYGPHIKDEGFSDWSNTSFRYLTARFLEYPLTSGRISWMKNKTDKKIPEIYLSLLKKLDPSLEEK